jgi:hypothetical protein
VLNEGSAEMGNTVRGLVTAVEGAQTGDIFGAPVSIGIVVSLHADVENNCSGTVLRLVG